jgi:hypothetical protein
LTANAVDRFLKDTIAPCKSARNLIWKIGSGQKAAANWLLILGSIAAAVMQRVTLAESQIFKPVGELRLFVDQARRGACRASGKKSAAEDHRKNDRRNFHGVFLSSSGLKQMKNKVKA